MTETSHVALVTKAVRLKNDRRDCAFPAMPTTLIASTGATHLYYEQTGEGPTLVLTHGIGSSADTWREVLPALAMQFNVIAWDVRGFGRSDTPPGPYSASQWASDLVNLLDVLAIDRAAILGHSMGGVIAQRFALDYPERLAALILESTSSEVGATARDYWLEQAAASDSHTFAAAARAVAEIHFTPELQNVRAPTLILQGLNDVRTPPGGSVIMSRNIPHSRLEMIEDTGHSIHGERPERFVGLVEGFLEDAGWWRSG